MIANKISEYDIECLQIVAIQMFETDENLYAIGTYKAFMRSGNIIEFIAEIDYEDSELYDDENIPFVTSIDRAIFEYKYRSKLPFMEIC